MKKLFILPTLLLATSAFAETSDLDVALRIVQTSCSGISQNLNHLKTMAGINTGITAVGTVAGGVALGTGIAKAQQDKEIKDSLGIALSKLNYTLTKEEYEKIANMTAEDWEAVKKEIIDARTQDKKAATEETAQQAEGEQAAEGENANKTDDADNKDGKKAKKEKKELTLEEKQALSKTLGNVRTGTLAAATATNIAGAAIAGTNKIDADLETQISACLASVKALNNIYMQERNNENVDEAKMDKVQTVLSKCGDWEYVDVKAINKRGTGALISSSVGAGTGLVGTITSALGNKELKSDMDEKTVRSQQNLNTTANVMAGGTTAAGIAATVFNATQISAIKRASNVADGCEEVLQ